MTDLIPISPEALPWLRQLARARETEDGWDVAAPAPCHADLLALGVVEYRPEAWRLSDIGWWVLNRLVVEGEE